LIEVQTRDRMNVKDLLSGDEVVDSVKYVNKMLENGHWFDWWTVALCCLLSKLTLIFLVFSGLVGYLGCHITSDLTFFKAACFYELDPIVLCVIKYAGRNHMCLYKVGSVVVWWEFLIAGKCSDKLVRGCVLFPRGCDDWMFLWPVFSIRYVLSKLKLDGFYDFCDTSELNWLRYIYKIVGLKFLSYALN